MISHIRNLEKKLQDFTYRTFSFFDNKQRVEEIRLQVSGEKAKYRP